MRCWLAIILCLGSSVPQSPKQHTENKQNTQTQAGKTAVDQSIPDTSKAPETQINTNNYQNSEGNETAKNISDGLLALFTLALVVVSVMQWRVLRGHEQWMEKHDAKLEQLAEAANKNADAARMNAETAEKSLRLTYAASLGIDPFITPAGEIIIELKNSGRTVARNVVIMGDIPDTYGRGVPYSVGPMIVPTDANSKAKIGNVQVKNDNGHLVLLNDLRCGVTVTYEDIFRDIHTRGYVLVFDRTTLKVKVEQESS
jgi:hypothetical protein